MITTELLVVGAGPYALSTGGLARERGINTVVVGHPMGFWRDNMPEEMFLRSGPGWHMDAAGTHTLAAFLQQRGIAPMDIDPIPIAVFLDYAEWFREEKAIDVQAETVADLTQSDGRFVASLADGEQIVAEAVICAPGIRHYTNLPGWASAVPPGRAAHTCDLVQFRTLAGARVLIVGGRQSAYEWAALLREHGVARVDIVHRHAVPRFDRVDWAFVDAHVERTMSVPGYWRHLSQPEQDKIGRQFWEAGRLTLEHWLVPRLEWDGIHRWPGTEVAEVIPHSVGDELEVRLSNSERLTVDRIIYASGYRVDLARVPYLASLMSRIVCVDGFPVLDEAFGTSLAGLYVTGFSASRDFGPFFGFVKGAPAAATLIVRDLLSRP